MFWGDFRPPPSDVVWFKLISLFYDVRLTPHPPEKLDIIYVRFLKLWRNSTCREKLWEKLFSAGFSDLEPLCIQIGANVQRSRDTTEKLNTEMHTAKPHFVETTSFNDPFFCNIKRSRNSNHWRENRRQYSAFGLFCPQLFCLSDSLLSTSHSAFCMMNRKAERRNAHGQTKASSKVGNSSWPVSIHGRSLLGFY